MFRTAFFIATIFGICLTGSISAQEVECSVAVREASDGLKPDGSITITMTSGHPAFTVYLFDKAPWKGGTQLRKTGQVSSMVLSLDEIPAGEYYIIVEDKDGLPWAKAVAVGIKTD